MNFRTKLSRRCPGPVSWVCLGVTAWLGMASACSAQVRQLQFGVVPVQGGGEEEESTSLTGGSPLDIDRRLKQSLDLAEDYMAEGKTAEALELWQNALARAKNTLTTHDDWKVSVTRPPERTYTVYRSISDEIERRLAKLPPADLRLYRQTYDADAGLVLKLNEGEKRLAALQEVVDQYFISSIGDESAYYLALLWFDQGDYARSARMLQKILADYPDSTVSPKQIRLRLALTSARMRDPKTAEKYWKEFQDLSEGNIPEEIRRLYAQELARASKPLVPQSGHSESWPMQLGGPARNRDMPTLPANAVAEKLSETWSQEFDNILEQTKASAIGNRRTVIFAGGIARTTSGSSVGRKPLGEEWRTNGWMPARQLYLDQGRLFINGNGRVLCFDAAEGQAIWKGRQFQYEVDPSIRYYAQMGANTITNGARSPSTIPEVRLFSDRLHPMLTIHENVVYALEGQLLDWGEKPNDGSALNTNLVLGRRRSRTNWMAAYDAGNGKLQWHRSASDLPNDDGSLPVAFLAAPVPFGDRLLVPVSSKGELWLHSLRQDTGETDWKVFLWDEPLDGVSPWSGVGTAVEGGDVYLATGMGLVFALDAATGKVHWAAKYPRKGAFPSANPRAFNPAMLANASKNGWIEDIAIPHGNNVIVLPSDYDRIITFDRRTGTLLWDAPQDVEDGLSANYCLGVSGDGLFVGGREVVRKFGISGGRLLWEFPIQNSLGQAALTADGIYVPTEDAIVKLDPESGKELARTEVYTPTGEPVGNLFSDGRHLYGVGLQRIYALANLTDRLKALALKIDQGDGEAQLVRMRIHLQRDNLPAAKADLEAAIHKIRQKQGIWKCWEALNTGLEELKLSDTDPGTALRLLVETHETRDAAADDPEPAFTDEEKEGIEFERSRLLYASLNAIQANPSSSALAGVLAATDLCTTPQLERQAIRAVATVASKDDRAKLEAVLKTGKLTTRLAAAEALLKLFDEESAAISKVLLADKHDRVRLQGAMVSANNGERDVLPILGGMLESEDVGVRVQASSILRALTKQNFRFTAYDDAQARGEIVAKWKNWIETEGKTAELIFPLNFGGEALGRTLYTDYNQSTIYELDENGKETWRKTGILGPWSCQGLPNGNRLATSYRSKSIHEFDEAGKEVWKKDGLPGYPFSVQRLHNGNTLISCSDSRSGHRAIEYTPAGKIAWEANLSGTPRSAQRLDNGNTLVAIYNTHEVLELDVQGKIVWRVQNMNSPIKAQRLPNGHTMVVQYNTRQLVELDANGKTVWAKGWNTSLYDAQRLSNGNTLIADTNGIHEIDPEGKTVFEKRQSGIRGICRF